MLIIIFITHSSELEIYKNEKNRKKNELKITYNSQSEREIAEERRREKTDKSHMEIYKNQRLIGIILD